MPDNFQDMVTYMRLFQDELKGQDLFRDIDEHFLRHYPWLMPESPHYSGKHEGWPDDVSKGDQTTGQSSDEVWVGPYEQERHGEEVPISGYWRHHTPSQHEGERFQVAAADAGDPPGPLVHDLEANLTETRETKRRENPVFGRLSSRV